MPEIILCKGQTVVIIDDDDSIHQVWRNRFNIYMDYLNVVHFYNPKEFIDWIHNRVDIDNTLYLCDHEFVNFQQNGLELINELKINYLSILVTSRNDLENIFPECEAKGIKFLHKENANLINVKVVDGI